MTATQTYLDFIGWLGSSWWEMPESVHRLPMIEAHYTVEEAAFLTGFPFRLTGLEALAELKGLGAEEMADRLSELTHKGMVYESQRAGESAYRLSDPILAMMRANLWPQEPKDVEWLREVSPHVNRYYLDNWADQWESAHVKGLRAIPINKTIKDPRTILPYEDVVKIVDSFEYFTVSNCPCRVRHRLDPDHVDCNHPLEVCLHFDDLGHYIVKNDMGREITKEETLAILKESADSGLIHGISTNTHKPDTICNCCGCCCLMIEPFHKMGHTGSMRPSNYRVEVEKAKCTSCALCVKRCPVDAIELKMSDKTDNKFGKAAVVDKETCIGCGVCVHKCPTEALSLEFVDEPTEPPRTAGDWVRELRQYQKSRK